MIQFLKERWTYRAFLALALGICAAQTVTAQEIDTPGAFDEAAWEEAYRREIPQFPPEMRAILEREVEEVKAAAPEAKTEEVVDAEQTAFEAATQATSIPVVKLNEVFVGANQEVEEAYNGKEKGPRYLILARLFARAVLKPDAAAIGPYLQNLVDRLMLPEFDGNLPYTVYLTPSMNPFSTATRPDKREIHLPLGLLVWSHDEAELAAVIAHEMTHNNPKHMESLKRRQEIEAALAAGNDKDVNEARAYSQREEIRADLGATDRLISAKINPWGMFNSRKSIGKVVKHTRSFWFKLAFGFRTGEGIPFLASHPHEDIFTSANMAYVVWRTGNTDLKDLLKAKHAFPEFIAKLRQRTMGIFGLMGAQKMFGIKRLAALTIGYGATYLPSFHRFIVELSFDPYQTPIEKVAHQVAYRMNWDPQMLIGWLSSSEVTALGMTSVVAYIAYTAWRSKDDIKNAIYNDDKVKQIATILTKAEKLLSDPKIGVVETVAVVSQLSALSSAQSRKLDELEKGDNQDRKIAPIFNKVYKVDLMETAWLRLLSYLHQVYLPHLLTPEKLAKKRALLWTHVQALDAGIMKGAYYPHILLERETSSRLIEISKVISERFARNYDLVGLTKIYSPKQFENELKFEYVMRIGMIDRNVVANLNPLQRLDLLEIATRLQLVGLILDLVTTYHAEMREIAHHSSDDRYMKIFAGGMGFVERARGLRKDEGRNSGELSDAVLAHRRQVRETGDDVYGTVTYTLDRSFYYQNSKDKNVKELLAGDEAFDQKIAQFRNILELKEYVGTLLNLNAVLSQVHLRLHKRVLDHLELVTTPEDVEALLSVEYFWNSLGSGYSSSELERDLNDRTRKLKKSLGPAWSYEIKSSEKLQKHAVDVLQKAGKFPTDFHGLKKLWIQLTDRGVTTLTDKIASDLLEMAGPGDAASLEELMVTDGRIWEPELTARLARRIIEREQHVEKIRAAKPADRKTLIVQLLNRVKQVSTSQNLQHRDLIESLSVAIESSEEESALFEEAKGDRFSKMHEQDLSVRGMSELVSRVIKWPKKSQFAFIKFLRGQGPSFKELDELFPMLGADRAKRMYDNLPKDIRATFVFGPILDSQDGLIPDGKTDTRWGRTLIDYIIGQQDAKVRDLTVELLEALLFASGEAGGNQSLRTYILAHILSITPSEMSSPGDVLRIVLSAYGALGVKIAQNLVASRLLPDAETEKLRTTQDNANPPEREEIYKDLRMIFKGKKIPFRLAELLGAASMKYAFRYEVEGTGTEGVGKVLRESALHRTRLEFAQVDAMVTHLMAKDAARYGVLRSIVRAAREAVEREMQLDQEALRSLKASRLAYEKLTGEIEIVVMRDAFVDQRFMISEFAKGVSIHKVDDATRARIARMVLEGERDILFSDRNEITFDPDRHAGNFKVELIPGDAKRVRIKMFDFGQLTTITRAEREQVLDLFAAAQVINEIGLVESLVERIIEIVGLKGKVSVESARPVFARYFNTENRGMHALTAYYSVLAAAEDLGRPFPIQHFDFMRAILQLNQYESMLGSDRARVKTPHDILQAETSRRAALLTQGLNLNWSDRWRVIRRAGIVKAYKYWRKAGVAPKKATCEELLGG